MASNSAPPRILSRASIARRHASSRLRVIDAAAFFAPFHFTSTCLTVIFAGSPLKRARLAFAVPKHCSAAAELGAALGFALAATALASAGSGGVVFTSAPPHASTHGTTHALNQQTARFMSRMV